MSTITLTRESHKNPSKFRINHQDELDILGPNRKDRYAINDKLPTITTSSKLAIIGAGFGGMAGAIKTMEKYDEHDIQIFERHDNFGRHRYANTYPGCASDIPALWYSFSFALTSNWSRIQPPQYEMEEYILRVAEKFKLKEKTRFQTEINKVEWDDVNGEWTLYAHDVKTGQRIIHKSKLLLACQGGLVHPLHFDAKGLENFKGPYMHSALWDHSVDFRGKKVVVIGNGCSANQTVPALLNDPQYNVGSLTQISRSKHYIMRPLPKLIYTLYRLFSFNYFTMYFFRLMFIFFSELKVPLFKGEGIISNYVRKLTTEASVLYIKEVAPEKYHDKLIPDYKIGCKRLIFDYNYVPSLKDPRIDIKTERIDKVVEDGILLESGEHIEADIIVACTGYNLSKSHFNFEIVGRKGADITQLWKEEGASAYRTLLIKHCPNLWTIGGTNSITGHASVVMGIENGVDYFLKTAKPVFQGKAKSVQVKDEAYDNWLTTLQKEINKSVFGTPFGGCVSWYSGAKVNSISYPWSQLHYWWKTQFPTYRDLNYEPLDENKKRR